MLNIVLFGAPGAGKGTQAKKLVEKFHLAHLSTGDLLRGEIAASTDLGKLAAETINRGELAPDGMVIAMIAVYIDKAANASGFIFDGFPRTSLQAIALDRMLEERSMKVSGMFALEVENDELIHRLQLRGKISGRMDDQSTEIIEHRIKVYHKKTEPIIHYYSAQGKYFPVQGQGAEDEVFARLNEAIFKIWRSQISS